MHSIKKILDSVLDIRAGQPCLQKEEGRVRCGHIYKIQRASLFFHVKAFFLVMLLCTQTADSHRYGVVCYPTPTAITCCTPWGDSLDCVNHPGNLFLLKGAVWTGVVL
jgi:hypothetical protein